MFKYIVILAVAFAATSADPKPGVLAAAPLAVAPAVAPAVVTAQSSQVIARNYNALAAAPLVAAPLAVAHAAPIVAAPSPVIAAAYRGQYLSSPVVAGSPYLAAPAVASPYVAAPHAPFAASPLYF